MLLLPGELDEGKDSTWVFCHGGFLVLYFQNRADFFLCQKCDIPIGITCKEEKGAQPTRNNIAPFFKFVKCEKLDLLKHWQSHEVGKYEEELWIFEN